MRTYFDPDQMPSGDFYRLLTSVVVPRPIAWVSTLSAEGIDNLAPHSFFTVSSVKPPIIQFTSVGEKDSLRNIRATGEFVVNMSPASLMAEVNATGTSFPPEVSEFDAAGLTREESLTVSPPRVKESPVALECKTHLILPMGDCTIIFGRVTHAAVLSEFLDGDHPGSISLSRSHALAWMNGACWGKSARSRESENQSGRGISLRERNIKSDCGGVQSVWTSPHSYAHPVDSNFVERSGLYPRPSCTNMNHTSSGTTAIIATAQRRSARKNRRSSWAGRLP
ncbi:flavin reductase family protein [Arthrobacter sp. ATA002]|uniref:flavin reductase family protein n=1 Tax=Arthrobacter sp. ATA002 TaxID=2991715 RepID=UPI0022A77749|nr:flavin reductase family protein [Arthrobacter sp. ATA002]WAP53141.1 flavin reductase family protein [Arthrobacter sp. ATA002]